MRTRQNGEDLRAMAGRVRARVIELAGTTPVHIGPCLSVTDILIAAYAALDVRPPGSQPVDRVVLSKGHAAAVLYFVLQEAGLLYEDPASIGRVGNTRAGHPTDLVDGVEICTGALGHGLAVGAGMALTARWNGSGGRVAVVLGDGELNEGSVWEAAAFGAHHGLSNLVAIIDRNGLQQSGPTEQVLDLEPLDQKWASFGWQPVTVDGHDLTALTSSLAADRDAPTVVIARTVKGKGVPFMENDLRWHQAQLDDVVRQAALDALAAG